MKWREHSIYMLACTQWNKWTGYYTIKTWWWYTAWLHAIVLLHAAVLQCCTLTCIKQECYPKYCTIVRWRHGKLISTCFSATMCGSAKHRKSSSRQDWMCYSVALWNVQSVQGTKETELNYKSVHASVLQYNDISAQKCAWRSTEINALRCCAQ